jgi:hypothetical protein
MIKWDDIFCLLLIVFLVIMFGKLGSDIATTSINTHLECVKSESGVSECKRD